VALVCGDQTLSYEALAAEVARAAGALRLLGVAPGERVLLLDLDYSNNSRRREPRPEFASRKWAATWMVWLQDFLNAFTFFV